MTQRPEVPSGRSATATHARGPVRFERVAHRGAPKERVENTLPGFLLALDHGADAVELDVHTTRDDEVVVHHDHTLQGHVIASSSWVDLSRLDLGGGYTMPRLADVLDAIGDRGTAYIELKGLHIESATIRIARKHGHRFALHSFDPGAIARVRKEAPDIPRGILLDRDTPHPVDELRRMVGLLGPRDVWPHWTLVDDSLVHTARELGVRVITWTVNSAESARTLASLGVDGLCSDDVRLLTNL